MPYTGLTVDSTTNNVDFITTAKLALTATITDAVLQIAGTTARLNGAINVTRSQISVFNPIVGLGSLRGQTSAIAYVNTDTITDTSNIVSINQSALSFQSSNARFQLLLSQIADSIIAETGNKNKLIIYAQPNCVLSNSQFINIGWLEFTGNTSSFANVSLIGTYTGIVNYQSGLINLTGLSIPSTISVNYAAALGEGNSGNNGFVFWNPINFDFTKILLTAANNVSRLGYTVSWRIKDSSNVTDVLVVYRDDRSNIGGTKTELARYTTDSTGTLVGTYDSSLDVTGGSISRPTLWVRTKQARQTGSTVAQNPAVLYTAGLVGGVYTQYLYAVDLVSAEIEIRSYLHLANAIVISPTIQVGAINADATVKDFASFILTPDTGITQVNRVTALSVTGIAHTAAEIAVSISHSIAEIYDSRKAYWRDNGGTPGVKIGAIANFGNLNITIATGVSIAPSVAKFSGGVQTSGTITLTDARTYNDVPVSVASGGSITASAGGNFNIQGWIGSGTTISSSAPSIFTVDSSQISNFIAGTNVTIQLPIVSITAPNFAQNTRVQVARLEPYSVPSTAISTATNIITITGNRFKSAAPATLVYFQLQAGATIPTTTPQIVNNTLYFVQASGVADSLTAGQFKLSLTQNGTAIAFSTQGTGNFTLTGITELDNSLAGASGYSVALTEPNNTLLRVSAQFWQNTTGCTATNFYQQNIIWNLTSGNAIADTVNINSNPDLIHNSLIGSDTKVFSNKVNLPLDGSTVTGISFNAQGIISLDPRLFASVAGYPTLTPQSAYLYTVYYRSAAAGIRIIGNQFTAQDGANFVFSGLKLDNIADGVRNTPNTPATIAGGYVATADGSNPISITSGAVYINADRRAVPINTAGAVAPTQQQLRDAQALTLSAGVVAATGSIDSKLDNAGGDFIDL